MPLKFNSNPSPTVMGDVAANQSPSSPDETSSHARIVLMPRQLKRVRIYIKHIMIIIVFLSIIAYLYKMAHMRLYYLERSRYHRVEKADWERLLGAMETAVAPDRVKALKRLGVQEDLSQLYRDIQEIKSQIRYHENMIILFDRAGRYPFLYSPPHEGENGGEKGDGGEVSEIGVSSLFDSCLSI